jgi:hypothetical protein
MQRRKAFSWLSVPARHVAWCENNRVARLQSGKVDHMQLCNFATLPLFSSLSVPGGILPVMKMYSTQRRKDAKAQSIFVVMGVLRP